jgi:hypothetical protein
MGAYTLRAVVVTGSRKWDDYDTVSAAIGKPDLIIHGDAQGADRLASHRADVKGIAVLPMPAQWENLGKTAGPIRNDEMVNVAKALRSCGWEVTCEAFPLPESKGTLDMMQKMEAAGFKVTNHGKLK